MHLVLLCGHGSFDPLYLYSFAVENEIGLNVCVLVSMVVMTVEPVYSGNFRTRSFGLFYEGLFLSKLKMYHGELDHLIKKLLYCSGGSRIFKRALRYYIFTEIQLIGGSARS